MAGQLILQTVAAQHNAEASDPLLETQHRGERVSAGADAERDSLEWGKNVQPLIR